MLARTTLTFTVLVTAADGLAEAASEAERGLMVELSLGELVLEPLALDVRIGDVPGEPLRVVPDP